MQTPSSFTAPSLALPRGIRFAAAGIAVLATLTSAAVSILAGIERGASVPERVIWVAIGFVILAGAHLLPALTRALPRAARAGAIALWLSCLMATTYGHTTFFLSAQQHAGELRASAVRSSVDIVPDAPQPGRKITAIARDTAKVTSQLAHADALKCASHCPQLDAQRISLRAQLSALRIEASQAEHQQASADARDSELARIRERAIAAQSDPATAAAASLMGVTSDTASLATALLLGLLVEAVACVCWLVALPSDSTPTAESLGRFAVTPDTLRATADSDAQAIASESKSQLNRDATSSAIVASQVPRAELKSVVPASAKPHRYAAKPSTCRSAMPLDEPTLVRLATAIAEKRIKPTVRAIRPFLGCGQARALLARRAWLEYSQAASSSSSAMRPRLVHSARVMAL